jgi:uncharacterized protein
MSKLSHVAINADDVDATLKFYGDTFGWQFAQWGPGFYRMAADDANGAGVTAAVQQRRELLAGRRTTGFECTMAVSDVRDLMRISLSVRVLSRKMYA